MTMGASDDAASSSETSFHSSSSGPSTVPFSDDDDMNDELARSAALKSLSGGHSVDTVEVTKLRLQREQRLRRVLSQRHLGQPEPVPQNAFCCTRAALSEEDTAWLYTLTNRACFERLMHGVHSTAMSALAGQLDTVLSHANPLFYFSYRMPVKVVDSTGDAVATSLREAPAMRRWLEDTPPILRKRPAPEKEDAGQPERDADGKSAAGPLQKHLKTSASSFSASSGLVAQSMKTWEAHLAATLTAEGETIDTFRHSRAKASYTDKKRFQERAAWQEYVREVRIQAQQRDREIRRALRRGEMDEPR
ncbi:conserved hypothetical protein [Leishmania mexicana MHOM/GT/2001/U1103]|uniref:BCNT-C domain-containing protein n=1 Tax=Leishmania mexicana (strain MHOM/GT/2001/U1103) TaxID=929439 RepID=E9ALC9_LEIMU|nr:conserved hypothetical protein [Leishmania mexicana MHOM/GT/2001/U1103]CBZ23732.1 conserved hypothetical protein [Leishmania mexicana MHOM/GT/2001/U1103]